MGERLRSEMRLLVPLLALIVIGAMITVMVRSGGDGSGDAAAQGPRILVATGITAPPPTVASEPVESVPTAVTRRPAQRRKATVPRHRGAQAIVIPHRSRPLGTPDNGSLEGGVLLPASGPDFFTWEFPTARSPSPEWRRVGTDTLVTWLQGVLRYFRAKYPQAPRIGIADLSLPHGGQFIGYGGLGHASHQNGLDADVLYPRLDRQERAASKPEEVDRALSQALVDTFVAAGARFCFVGPHLGLTGPPAIVQTLVNHDDHVHVRIWPQG